MRLRKLLLATTAIAVAGAIALAPTALANNPNGGSVTSIVVGGSAANSAYPMALTMKSAQVQTNVFGIPTVVPCGIGAGTATTNGGLTGLAPLAGQIINVLNLTCAGFLPVNTLTIAAVCPLEIVYADPNVHVGLLDTGVPGNLKFSAVDGTIHMTDRANPTVHCLQATHSNGCQFLIGGNTAVQFDEAVKANGSQDLHLLGGPGLQVKNPNAACLGAFPANAPITLTAVLNESDPVGPVDFHP